MTSPKMSAQEATRSPACKTLRNRCGRMKALERHTQTAAVNLTVALPQQLIVFTHMPGNTTISGSSMSPVLPCSCIIFHDRREIKGHLFLVPVPQVSRRFNLFSTTNDILLF